MNISPSIVRSAVPADEGQLWELFHLMHEETALFPLDEGKVQDYLRRVLYPETIPVNDTGPRGIIGVIGSPARLEAAIMLVLGSVWYSSAVTLMDALNFVHPSYRQSDHAKTLISYGKHMVDEIRKVHTDLQLMIGIVSTKRTQAKIRLFRRQMVEAGAVFIYPPPAGYEPAEATQR